MQVAGTSPAALAQASKTTATNAFGAAATIGLHVTAPAENAPGTVYAWGWNVHGGLGDGTTKNRGTPVQVSGLTAVTAIAGGGFSGYALDADGTVHAWGANGNGELGDGTTTDRLTPVQVSGLTGVTAIAGGFNSGYALRSNGTVHAWGANGNGELGDGTTTDRSIPVRVRILTGVTAIAGGVIQRICPAQRRHRLRLGFQR